MPLYRLLPLRTFLENPAWAWSWEHSPCEVTAASADEARRVAAGWFTVPLRRTSDDLVQLFSPWLDPTLVSVELREQPQSALHADLSVRTAVISCAEYSLDA